jgi:hypothetical protein
MLTDRAACIAAADRRGVFLVGVRPDVAQAN